jgi:hypothetical protein
MGDREMVEYGVGEASLRGDDRRLAQIAAERHPEAYAAELPESWAGHDVDMVLELVDRAPRSQRLRW